MRKSWWYDFHFPGSSGDLPGYLRGPVGPELEVMRLKNKHLGGSPRLVIFIDLFVLRKS
jgi:hypothetical protein